MDKNKKIETFFKKRINDFDTPIEDWEKPGLAVFQNAQNHFPKYPQKKKRERKVIFILLIGALFLALLGYIYHLSQKTQNLESELKTAQINLEEKSRELIETKQELSKEIKVEKIKPINTQTINTRTTTESRTVTSSAFNKKRSAYKPVKKSGSSFKKSDQEETEILFFDTRKEQALKELNTQEIKQIEKQKTKEPRLQLIAKKEIPLLKNEFKFPKLRTNISLTKPLKQNKNRFEVGLYLASLIYEIPVYYETTNLEVKDNKVTNYPIKISAKRIHLAYALRPNLWITTGLRNGNYNFDKKISSKLVYDKAEEYEDEEGKTKNDFDINAQTNYSASKNGLSLEVPEGTDIPNGDFLEASWNHIQELQFIQVPIGLEYYLGQDKFQWHLKGGLAWNKVIVNDYFFDIKVVYDNELLPLKEDIEKINFKKSETFITGYAGLGINYALTEKWHLRTSFIAERNFKKSKIVADEKFKSRLFDRVIEVGINYRW